MSTRDWTPVTKHGPCPACGKPDWCAWSREGWLKCERVTDTPHGMERISLKGSGAVFKPAESGGLAAPSGRPRPVARSQASDPGEPAGRTFSMARDALKNLEQRHGTSSARWTYTDAEGVPVGLVVRWNTKDGGKRILPVSRHGDVWMHKGMPKPRPLYRLPEVITGAERVYVNEGEKAADCAVSIGLNGTTSAHGAQAAATTDWSPLAGREVVILPDADKDGAAYARTVASVLLSLDPPARVKIIELPGLPPKGDIVEYVEARTAAGLSPEAVKAEIEALAEASPWASVGSVSAPPGGCAETWPDPEPLPDELPPVEKFDPNLLPEAFRAWAVDIAERTQCPIDFVAVALMVALSSVVGRTIGIRPKKFDDWTVVPNLWGGAIGRPGVMKTPAIQESLKPLRRLDLEAKREFDDLAKEIAAAQEVAEAKKKHKRKQIDKAVKDGEDAHHLAMESIDDDDESVPTRKRYIVYDSSVEKLGEILNENPRGVLAYRDELIGLLKSLDKDGQEGARSFYLEAWNGNGSYIYDRIGRGTIDIEAAIVSVLGGIQPDPLSFYMRGVAKGGGGDDGLMQRFQLLVWPDISGKWINVDRWPNAEARKRVFEVFEGVDALEPDLVGADGDPMDPEGIPFLRFEDEAQVVFDEWRAELEPRVRSGELHPALEAHLSKYRSLVPSLALLCHLADGGRGPVGAGHLLKALEWADYLETHARRVYAQAINPDVVAARSLGKHILAGQVKDGFALRDVYRKGWGGLSSAEDAKDGAAYLIELGWLREERVFTEGRTATIYFINPTIPGLKNTDTPPEGTDRTDRSPPETPSVGSVSAEGGALPKKRPLDDDVGEGVA